MDDRPDEQICMMKILNIALSQNRDSQPYHNHHHKKTPWPPPPQKKNSLRTPTEITKRFKKLSSDSQVVNTSHLSSPLYVTFLWVFPRWVFHVLCPCVQTFVTTNLGRLYLVSLFPPRFMADWAPDNWAQESRAPGPNCPGLGCLADNWAPDTWAWGPNCPGPILPRAPLLFPYLHLLPPSLSPSPSSCLWLWYQ